MVLVVSEELYGPTQNYCPLELAFAERVFYAQSGWGWPMGSL